jgi:sugar phosphate isomerase/epimerase
MRLSLSVRVAEKFDNKEESSLTIDQLIELARTNGYAALCMRASQAGIHTAAETVREMSGKIHGAGLAVSMVTGDFAVPRNDDHGPDGLRKITPYLDLAEAFQSNLIRVCMKKDEDIEWAQKAADEAKERGIRLAHQAHDASMFETVVGSLEVLKKVGRENFGLIYEPANWMIADFEKRLCRHDQVLTCVFASDGGRQRNRRRSEKSTAPFRTNTMMVTATSATNTPVVSKFIALNWMR